MSVKMKMNLEDDKIEPVTDLGLSLDYSDQYNQREALNIDPSAGANAGSSVHMTFVATNPLTELVWSPHKGLSLKCADCSFSDGKPALTWGARPSNTAGMECLIEPVSEPNLMELEEIVDAKIGFTTVHNSSDKENAVNGDNMPEMKLKAPPEVSLSDKSFDEGNLRDGQRGGRSGLVDLKMVEASKCTEKSYSASPGCEEGTIVNIPASQLIHSDASGDQKLGIDVVPVSEVHLVAEHHPVDKHKPSDEPLISLCKDKGKRIMSVNATSLHRSEKLESTAENVLQAMNIGNTAGAGIKVTLESESAAVIKSDPVLDCEVNPGDDIIFNSHSAPSKSRVRKHENRGKGKALSEGDVNGRFSKDEEEDDSYESVESCNSAGIFSTGKRRWSFEQQLIGGSKRAKQIERIPGTSSTPTKHDSSFLNWISNMMKGFARPLNQDEEARPLRFAPANPSRVVHENMDAAMDGDIQLLNSRSMGFKSIFQSIYCPNKSAEGMTTCFNQLGEGSAETELANQTSLTDAGMLHCFNKGSDNKVSKGNLNEAVLGKEVVPLGPPQVSFGNFVSSWEIGRACSSGNRNSNDFGHGKGKDATKTSESSLNGRNAKIGENNSSPTSEEKRANDLGYRGDPFRSLWVTRFCPRPCSVIKEEVGNLSIAGACESGQNSLGFCWDEAALEVRDSTDQEPSHVIGDREPKNFLFCPEPSVGFGRIEDPALMHKENRILPSMRLKSSEVMASVFARRLDALKNIISSSDVMDDSSRATTTCFFCGIKGHHLQNCSEITETELEDLLKNIKSYDKADGSPCLCIRCFQLNHWAVACPNVSQKNPEDNLKCNLKLKEVFTIDRVISSSNQAEKKSNVNVIAPSGDLEKWQVREVPKGIFSAIKTLRLSRTDILKWMKTRISLSHLDGFFLRLRLGKWEEGFGGTGYYVACITGMQRKSLVKDAKSPISVNVGGVKCLVESQYISNHDFLEDELMAWWCIASRNGGKVLSEEDLKMKAEEKKMLGF
ncbi:uncharacterized protein LOC116207423 isoform X1 [Punica granatum]|uniref:Uncharacterized protein LOC116207423 isoform X1 n=2 Tax=Punica granatum TaxID=22663 RepID=A0A6P8DSF7_PUNGR|nr:uncharacterized protein LOC116207423 isoform X1 [Punica granatum]